MKRLSSGTDPRDFARHVGPDGCGEERFLVPGQQIPGESHRQHQAKERATGNPENFAAAFVCAVEKCLRQMKQQHNDDGTRAVGVQAAQKRSAGYFLNDVSDGRVRVIGRRRIIKRKKYSGDGLRDKQKEQDRAENVGPARAARDRLVQCFVHQRSDADATIQPMVEALPSARIRMGRFSVRLLRVSHVAFLLGENFLCRNELAEILVAHFQHAVVDLALEIVHRSRSWTGNTGAIEREDGGVAWTDKLLLRFNPRNRTAQVRANRRQHAHESIFHRQNVNCFFRDNFPPAVPLVDRNQPFSAVQ